jgi:N-acetyl-gamma-glutamyl-phosphate reductase
VNASVPAVVLGGSGYVAGELLRLLAMHPHFRLAGALSDSKPGEPVAASFGHLASVYPEERFASQSEIEAIVERERDLAIFCAAPHGSAAALIDTLLRRSERAHEARSRGGNAAHGKHGVHVVDISADFRYASASAYEAVYKHPHGAPARLAAFSCALPEHLAQPTTSHIGHPGCFSTATLLASVPLLALGLAEPELFVSAITGSTGSGRKPVEGTHHPLRHSDLYAYNVLSHRHVPEITACALAASGVEARYTFVPHSGPFARGIHVTLQARLKRSLDTTQLLGALHEYYARAPFVRVLSRPPRIKEVVASNYAQLSAVSDGRSAVVLCTVDNLCKGAAGGAVQWMNRLFGLPESAGLIASAPGWT